MSGAGRACCDAGVGGGWRRRVRFRGEGEGDLSETAEEAAEETAGLAVGDAEGTVFEEAAEDGVDF